MSIFQDFSATKTHHPSSTIPKTGDREEVLVRDQNPEKSTNSSINFEPRTSSPVVEGSTNIQPVDYPPFPGSAYGQIRRRISCFSNSTTRLFLRTGGC